MADNKATTVDNKPIVNDPASIDEKTEVCVVGLREIFKTKGNTIPNRKNTILEAKGIKRPLTISLDLDKGMRILTEEKLKQQRESKGFGIGE